ncbi:MAG: fibronectin type III domain-containing protein [Oleiphilaceae bacterium]|nr:fibronectin type III domain-containing protein [Oleiphilaceae bacterium]
MSAFRIVLQLILLCLTILLIACEEPELQAEFERRSGNGSLQSLTPGTLQVTGQSRLMPHQPHSTRHKATASPPTLSWHPPMQRANGEKLYPGEIEGYRLYYQASNEARVRIIVISDPDQTRRVLDDFGPGDYRFTMTSVDTSGMESEQSGEVVVSVAAHTASGTSY